MAFRNLDGGLDGVLVLLGIGPVSVAVFKIDTVILDCFPLEFAAHALMHGLCDGRGNPERLG